MKTISQNRFRIYLVVLAALSFVSYGFWALIMGKTVVDVTDEVASFLLNIRFLMVAGFIFFVLSTKMTTLPQNRKYLKAFLVINAFLILADASYVFYAITGDLSASFLNTYNILALMVDIFVFVNINCIRVPLRKG